MVAPTPRKKMQESQGQNKPTVPMQDVLQQIKQISVDKNRARDDQEQRERHKEILELAKRAYPRTITIKNFEVAGGDENKSYPAIKITPKHDDGIKKFGAEKIIPEKELKVVFTDKTTNMEAMKQALEILKNGQLELLVKWKFEFDKKQTRITKAEVDTIHLTSSYKDENHLCDTIASRQKTEKVLMNLPDRAMYDDASLSLTNVYSVGIHYYRALYSSDGLFKDETRVFNKVYPREPRRLEDS